MGTWDATILGNDTSAQTHESFFRRYDAGEAVSAIVKQVEAELRASLRLADDRSNVELALALALWECASLDRARLEAIRRLVRTGKDLAAKRRLGADAAFVAKRRRALNTLLRKISRRNLKPRPRRPAPKATSLFRAGCCFAVRRVATFKRGPTYYAFWISSAALGRVYGDLGVVCLDLEQRDLPTLEQCERAFVRGIVRVRPGTYRGDQQLYMYDGDRAAFFAAFEKFFVIGHTSTLKGKRVLWGSSGFGLDWAKDRALGARLLRLFDDARAKRWPRRVRLGELVGASR